MSFRAPRRVRFDGNEGMIRPGLHPPRPGVCINNNLLLWSSVSYPSRDRVDSFSSTFRRRRNMGELDRRSGIAFMRLATVQSNAENQQQRSRQENWDQQSQLHVTAQAVAISDRDKGPRSLVCFPQSTHILLVTHYSEHELTREKKAYARFQDSGNWPSIAKSGTLTS